MGTLNPAERPPLLPALAAQCFGLLTVGLPVLLFFPALLEHALLLAMLQGGIAALAARWMQAPPWWPAIHLGFMPLLVLVRLLELPGWIWPSGLALLLLVFWRTDRSRVPLYLSSRGAADAVLRLLPPGPCRVIDLGCGDGALLRHLAAARPESHFVGIEHAPLPWLWARMAGGSLSNLTLHRGDFWAHSLADYDVVYAFLSPAPMPRLWAKACAEMPPDAMLVSNSFAVPGQMESQRIAVNDRAMTYFYVYRPGSAAV
ncbi:MAG: methyltransferase type 12 [Rhodocyclales bacterium]|nr:methyltransferase type 12 [Rhodocyclales bacterium]